MFQINKALFLGIILIPGLALGQYRMITPESKVSIDGTSTMHDWTSISEVVKGTADFMVENGELKGVNKVNIQVKVEDIKSGKSLMDSKTYEAFNYKTNPYIKGTWTETTSLIKSGNSYKVKGKGTLEMNGKKMPADFESTCTVDGNKVSCTGSQKINMTDFDMKPPTAMMGTIKVGEDVEVRMEFVFSK